VDVDGDVGELLAKGTDEAIRRKSQFCSTEEDKNSYIVAASGLRRPAMSLMARTWMPQSTSSWAKLR
jgi:hypothetical protein